MTKDLLISRFDGGMTSDPRDPNFKRSRLVKHFDILSAPNRMTPSFGVLADGSVGDTEKLVRFLSYNSKQYGLGVVSGTSRAKIFERASLPAGAWTQTHATLAESATGTTRNEHLFLEYQGIFYGGVYVSSTDTRIWAFDPSGPTFTETAYDLGLTADLSTSTTTMAGLVHSKDDILYIGYDNKVIKKDSGAANTGWSTALTLPVSTVITSLCEKGNYLVIGVKYKYTGGKSTAYYWDRNTANLDYTTDKVDFGSGDLVLVEELDGQLIGISAVGSTNATVRPKLVFKYQTGNGSRQFAEIISTNFPSGQISSCKQKVNNRLLFQMGIQIQGLAQNGVWSVGRSMDSGDFAVSMESVVSTDITDSTFFVPKGFHLLEDFMTIAYTNSTYFCVRTDGSFGYNSPSVYESLIINFGDSAKTKKLLGATVLTSPFTLTTEQVILKYRINEETAWTRIFKKAYSASDLPGNVSHDANRIEIGSETVTMTIASPAVVTLNNHDLIVGQQIIFRTTGALPTGVTAGTIYYVSSVPSVNTFQFSATSGGSSINTSGTQSGTHTVERDANLREFKEIQFRIESTGGAIITGLQLKAEDVDRMPF